MKTTTILNAYDAARSFSTPRRIRQYEKFMHVLEARIEAGDRAIAALKQVEWVFDEHGISMYRHCPWCGGYEHTNGLINPGHSPNCLRQLALGIGNVTE